MHRKSHRFPFNSRFTETPKTNEKTGKKAMIYTGYIKRKTPKHLYLSALSSAPERLELSTND